VAERGPCAKRRVVCTIRPAFPHTAELARGENDCATPQATCPRAPGEGYEKCKTICGQAGHAEVEAIREARRLGIELRGARAVLTGHYWICEPCGRALHDAGVRWITIEIAKP
jgi:deoxycytidylate deaminase